MFYQIGKGLSRMRVRDALRMVGLDPDAWTWMYNPRSGTLRVFQVSPRSVGSIG